MIKKLLRYLLADHPVKDAAKPTKEHIGDFLECPKCLLAAEVAGSLTFGFEESSEKWYVIQCLGNHEPLVARAEWLEEYLSQ